MIYLRFYFYLDAVQNSVFLELLVQVGVGSRAIISVKS